MNNLLNLQVSNLDELSASYLRNFKSGGLLLKSNLSLGLNDEVFVVLDIIGNKFAFNGAVVYISSVSDEMKDIGIRFIDENGLKIKIHIEKELGDLLKTANSRINI